MGSMFCTGLKITLLHEAWLALDLKLLYYRERVSQRIKNYFVIWSMFLSESKITLSHGVCFSVNQKLLCHMEYVSHCIKNTLLQGVCFALH
jgi:hypothetical protein